jgi:hypothetical protein
MKFIIKSVTSFLYRCITYISQSYDLNPIPFDLIDYVLDFPEYINLFGLIHQTKKLPHLITDKYNIELIINDR